MELRWLGCADYLQALQAMREFTEQRDAETPDELWLCEHPSVFTLGVAGDPAHVLNAGGIPVVASNRGGQVTYHGPGQVVAYPLVDLRRLGLYAKEYVFRLEQAALNALEGYGVTGHRVPGAPGIYVRPDAPGAHAALSFPADARDPWRGIAKIAALGIKITRRGAYHGLALNVAMDLSPFARINPCGYPGLAAVDLFTIGVSIDWRQAAADLARRIQSQLTPRTRL